MLDVSGQRVLVLGLGVSGRSAAAFCAARGARVVAADERPLQPGADALPAGVTGKAGAAFPDPADFDLVVPSPGVPPERYRARARRVWGDIELCFRALSVPIVAVTGTNGKSTTVHLVAAMLRSAGLRARVAGNVGVPALELVGAPLDVAVLEVSSFQLETVDAFRPAVAAVLNVTPDHLDRHGTFEAYLDAKARIFRNQTADDCAVLNADDDATAALAARTRARVVWFSRRRALEAGVFVREGWIVARRDGRDETVGPLGEVRLRGQHNVENVLAAAACALARGVAPAAIRRAVAAFPAVTHRIEPVRELDGVAFYNDSKGTNVASTVKALESFAEPVVLIAGGKGKGQDFAPLARAARGRVAHVVVIGEDGPRVAAALSTEGVAVTRAGSMAEAVATARAVARPGHVVLLSPACASFDMFDNFEHRGEVFRAVVQGLR